MILTALIKRNSVELTELNKLKQTDKSSLTWVYAIAPSEAEKGELLKLKVVPRQLLAKYEREQRSTRYSFSPLRFAVVDYYLENGQVQSSHLLFAQRGNMLLTIASKKSNYYEKLFEKILERIKQSSVQPTSPAQVLYEFLQEDVNDNYEVIQNLEERIIKLEEEAAKVSNERITPASNILALKRQLYKMNRRLWATTKIIFAIRKTLTKEELEGETHWLLEEVYDTLMHQIDNVTVMQEMLTDVLTVYSTNVSNDIGNKVKKLTYITLVLTGIATVIGVPNTIATMFGIPYFPHTLVPPDSWPIILTLLLISSIIPALWLLMYWKKHGVKIGR